MFVKWTRGEIPQLGVMLYCIGKDYWRIDVCFWRRVLCFGLSRFHSRRKKSIRDSEIESSWDKEAS